MVQQIDDGPACVEAQKKTGRIFQVGSQRVSSIVYEKARELIKAGAIGELNMIEAWSTATRRSAPGSTRSRPTPRRRTVDWDRFLGTRAQASVRTRPPVPLAQLSRLRHGRGGRPVRAPVLGHALRHWTRIGPDARVATGGLRYWKDGRDVPDVHARAV